MMTPLINQALSHSKKRDAIEEAFVIMSAKCKRNPLFDPQLAMLCGTYMAGHGISPGWAAMNGHVELLDHAMRVNGECASNLINLAIAYNSVMLMDHLISCSIASKAAMHSTAAHAQTKIMRHLIERHGAPINWNQNTPLRLAAQNNDLEFAQYLINAGADVHARYDDPVWRASRMGHLEMVQYLISMGAHIVHGRWSSLSAAAHEDRLAIVEYLISIGADVRANNMQAFKEMAKISVQIVERLIRALVNTPEESQDEAIYSAAIDVAIEAENTALIRLVVPRCNYVARSKALVYATNARCLELANEINQSGPTIHIQATINDPDVMMRSILEGKFVCRRDVAGAIRSGHFELMQEMLKIRNGLPVHLLNSKMTKALNGPGYVDLLNWCIEVAHVYNRRDMAVWLNSQLR